MTGRSDSDGEPDDGSRSGRLILIGAVVLALGATGVVVFTSNPQWLRLGVLAALWAALLGAFLAMKYRRQVAERADDVAELQSVYELELEREVAARREYELEIETETRRRVEEEGRDDLTALRSELQALRENLDRLTGGEVLVERIALRAQSTRMRSFGGADPDARRLTAEPEERRSITAGPPRNGGNANNGQQNERRRVVEPAPTELIDPAILAGEDPSPRRQPPAPREAREAPPREPVRPAAYRPEPVRPANRRTGSVVVEQVERTPTPQPKPPVRIEEEPRTEREHRRPDGRPDPALQPPTRPAMPPAPLTKQARPAERREERPVEQSLPGRRPAEHREHREPERTQGSHSVNNGGHNGGGRRRAEDRPAAERTVLTPALAEARHTSHTSHERRAPERPAPQPDRHSRRAYQQEEPPPPALAESEPTGAHAGGVSVTELLAAHANQDGAPRRRRRAN